MLCSSSVAGVWMFKIVSYVVLPGKRFLCVSQGSVVIAAITSCTNTSNPSVMIGAGLLARRAVVGFAVYPLFAADAFSDCMP